MCLKTYYKYECGCPSTYVNEVGRCTYFQCIATLQEEKPSNHNTLVDLCEEKCAAETLETTASKNTWCPACMLTLKENAKQAAEEQDRQALAYYDEHGLDGGTPSRQG